MMLAIVNDRFDMAATLLALGADANDGSLWYARDARRAHRLARARRLSPAPRSSEQLTALELIERLLAAGADPNKPFTGQMHNAVDVLRHASRGHAVLSRRRRRGRRRDASC